MPSRCGTVWWKFNTYQSLMNPCCPRSVDYRPCESRCAVKWDVSAASNAEEAIASPHWGSGHAALRWYGLEPQQSKHGSLSEPTRTTWSCSSCIWWPQTGRQQTSAQIHGTQPCNSPQKAWGVHPWLTWWHNGAYGNWAARSGSIQTWRPRWNSWTGWHRPGGMHDEHWQDGWPLLESDLQIACPKHAGGVVHLRAAFVPPAICSTCLDSPWRPACCEEDEGGDALHFEVPALQPGQRDAHLFQQLIRQAQSGAGLDGSHSAGFGSFMQQ